MCWSEAEQTLYFDVEQLHIWKKWFEAVSENLSVKDIATKMKFVMEGGNENLRGRISWNGLFNATSSWNDMNSVIQVAAEMIYVMEVGTEVKSTVEEIHLWWKLKQNMEVVTLMKSAT